MASWNEITGDPLVSRGLTKEGGENFDKIFGKKKTNGGWKPPTDLAKPVVTPTQPTEYAEDWQSSERDRAVAQNGNVGYSEEEVNGD
mgnify:CR=1 FL=1